MGPRVTRFEQSDLDVFLKSCRYDPRDTVEVKTIRISNSTAPSTTRAGDLLDSFRKAGAKIKPEHLIRNRK